MADQRWTEADVQAVLARQKPHSAVLAPYSPQEPRRTLGVPEDDEELESAFMARIRRLARQYGWATYHTHDSRKSDKGFPDLVLVRETILFVELKTKQENLPKTRRRGSAYWHIRTATSKYMCGDQRIGHLSKND